jgi:hypothetical protein
MAVVLFYAGLRVDIQKKKRGLRLTRSMIRGKLFLPFRTVRASRMARAEARKAERTLGKFIVVQRPSSRWGLENASPI